MELVDSPALSLDEYKDALTQNPCTRLIAALGQARQNVRALTEGDYRELFLTWVKSFR